VHALVLDMSNDTLRTYMFVDAITLKPPLAHLVVMVTFLIDISMSM